MIDELQNQCVCVLPQRHMHLIVLPGVSVFGYVDKDLLHTQRHLHLQGGGAVRLSQLRLHELQHIVQLFRIRREGALRHGLLLFIAQIFHAHQRDVIELLGIPRKGGNIPPHALQQLPRFIRPMTVQEAFQPFGPIEALLPVLRLRGAVRVQEQAVLRLDVQLLLAVTQAVHPSQHEAGTLVQIFEGAAQPVLGVLRQPQQRRIMPGIDVGKLPGFRIQDAQPRRHEHIVLIALAQQMIDLGENIRRRASHVDLVLDQDLCDHHQQRGRNALSGNVCDHQRHILIIHHEEIVEISAHGLGRIHGGVECNLPGAYRRREDGGQHVCLNVVGQVQLRFHLGRLLRDPLLLEHHLAALLRNPHAGDGQQRIDADLRQERELNIIDGVSRTVHAQVINGIPDIGPDLQNRSRRYIVIIQIDVTGSQEGRRNSRGRIEQGCKDGNQLDQLPRKITAGQHRRDHQHQLNVVAQQQIHSGHHVHHHDKERILQPDPPSSRVAAD